MSERVIAGRTIREGHFTLEQDDYLVMVSDGYIHAGVGGLVPHGLGLEQHRRGGPAVGRDKGDTHQLGRRVDAHVHEAVEGPPRRRFDCRRDVGAAAAKGNCADRPAGGPAREAEAVRKLLASEGVKAICGGTTAQMASRVLGKPLQVSWQPVTSGPGRKLPPMGQLEGVDLVTEGILTLSSAVDRLRGAQDGARPAERSGRRNPPRARTLLDADQIHFIVGDAINPQQLADVVRGVPMRQLYLEELIAKLRERNKTVTVEHL